MSTRSQLQWRLFVACFVPLAGCTNDAVTPHVTNFETENSYVARSVLTSIDGDGLFILAGPLPTGRAMITPDRASELAEALMRKFGPYVRQNLERQHGARIEFDALDRIGRVFVAETPHEPLPASMPNTLHKHTGAYYIVNLGSNGIPTVSVPVSVFATDISVTADGRIHYSGSEPVHGAEFSWQGIPLGMQGLVRSPEEAVEIASRATNARVTQVPQYYRRGAGYGATVGYWKITLERAVDVTFKGSQESISTRTIYVDGRLPEIAVARPNTERVAPRVSREADVLWRTEFSSEFVAITDPTEEGN